LPSAFDRDAAIPVLIRTACNDPSQVGCKDRRPTVNIDFKQEHLLLKFNSLMFADLFGFWKSAHL
jgi:hypothetical protein